MESSEKASIRETLRGAQRAFTRSRIRDAGRDLFFKLGYEKVSVDEIAQAAGASRSTLYAHFRDKDAILEEIVAVFMPSLLEVISSLRGPVPTRAEIDAWIRELALFLARARTPAILIVGTASAENAPPAIRALGDQLITAFAEQLPSFRRALLNRPEGRLAKAWASVVIREVGWACRQADHRDARDTEALLTVAGDLFERFVQEQTGGPSE